MKYNEKRSLLLDDESVQRGNMQWWTDHTMSYDWKTQSGLAKFSPEWFDDIDRRFLQAARLFGDGDHPFAALMDASALRGKRVLEIGCGMGFHTELLARAGAIVTAIDLSPTSVGATQTRLQQKKIEADVRQMDAEALVFPAGSFDMVWSWGVIHHSSRTGRIVREIERVVKPGGDARIMVYNLEGAPAYVTLVRRYLFGFWRGQSLDELLWKSTDGFSARFYTRDALADLLATFFDRVDVSVLGQEPDVVPLPATLRRSILKLIPIERQRALAQRRGAYLFAVARKQA
jgi:2-polyprenyl-3-methyl-5-hydroxy-6-metoxy-1,4-benzoquinol methylase